MLSAGDNALLTQTGSGAPMGEYFRRFWMPVALSRELPEPDCPPVRVRIMGEDLVAFRDSEGRIGLLEPRCPHRGANLFFGRNEQCGLRCVYHGWKFDVAGRCVDLPTLPAESTFRERVRVTAYPVREWGDFVWAYLGPAGHEPELPRLEFAVVPPSHRFVSKKLQQCNWAQSCEGGLDTAHFSFLHMPVTSVTSESDEIMSRSSADRDRTRWMRDDPMPEFHVVEHEAGLAIGASRRADGTQLYWRVSQFLLPNHGLAPNAFAGENYHGQTWVPITDESCWVYCYTWNPERPLAEAERQRLRAGQSVHAAVDERWMPIRNRDNDYLIDRVDQKLRTFTGIRGISEQDACIQDSQGFIADRTREHLGPTDAAIIQFRRLVLGGARELLTGTEPAPARNGAAYTVRSGSALADRSVMFAQVMRERFGDEVARVSAPASERTEESHAQSGS
ncbi:MAG TPA: Rieske 2Fe-2S domain-containing protein [Candidatus Bathyarchaeia archaeon]|nr:Rieske 2Fe-2S domain-containing protein [Candidatus Bathyarchaeia archaeon]